jgi:hypothetical protein
MRAAEGVVHSIRTWELDLSRHRSHLSRSTSPEGLRRPLRISTGAGGQLVEDLVEEEGLRWSELIAARYAHARVRAEPVVSGERRSPFPALRQNAAGSPKTRLP